MNKIIKIANHELNEYKEKINAAYIVELDGKKIKNWNDYINLTTPLFKIENLEYGYNQHIDNLSLIHI